MPVTQNESWSEPAWAVVLAFGTGAESRHTIGVAVFFGITIFFVLSAAEPLDSYCIANFRDERHGDLPGTLGASPEHTLDMPRIHQ